MPIPPNLKIGQKKKEKRMALSCYVLIICPIIFIIMLCIVKNKIMLNSLLQLFGNIELFRIYLGK